MDTSVSTPQAVATVISVESQAFARTPAGQMRALKAGDVIREGETIVTTANGQVQLAFVDGHILTVLPNETYYFSAETSPNTRPSTVEASLAAGDIERVIQALERGENIDDVLDPTAAGVDGAGENGGNNFIRLMRIVEGVGAREIPFGTGFAPVNARQDVNNNALSEAIFPTSTSTTTTPVAPTAPPVPTITLASNITPDDVINATESGQVIAITGSVGGDAKAGDTVTLTVNGTTYSGAVAADLSFSIGVPGADLVADADRVIDASVTTTDATGNSGSATDTESYSVDTLAAATISVDPITSDDIVNASEAGGTINVTGSVGGDAAPGDTVSFTINGTPYSGLVGAGNLFSIAVAGSDLANDTSFDATVTGSDGAGNPFSATTTSTHTVDTTTPTFSAQSFGYNENQTAGATVATLVANDNVAITNFTFSATGTQTSADSYYQINNSGAITLTTAGAASNVNDYEQLNNSGIYAITARDAAGNTTTANITLSELNLNDNAPTTSPVTLTAIAEDSGARLITQAQLLGNANDADGSSLTATGLVISSGSGVLVNNGNGTWSYTPALNDESSVSFSYSITDGTYTIPGSANLDITPVNDAPVAINDSASVAEDATVTRTAITGVLSNDTDPDIGDTKTVTDVAAGFLFGTVGSPLSGIYGTLTLNADGSYTYVADRPDAQALAQGEMASEDFEYTMMDSSGATSTALLTFTITGTNDAAVITGASTAALTETNAVQSTGGTLSATDVDSSNAFVAQTGVAGSNGYGSFSINAAGVWTYTMNTPHNEFVAGTNYTDSITVATADGTTQVITVTIAGTNDLPTGTDNTFTTNEDTAYTFSAASFGYSDVEGSALASVRIDTLPAAGTLLLSGVPVTAGQVITAANLGNLTFAPAANANGTGYASFTFSVNDGTGFDATPNTITMNVTAVNDLPTGSDNTFATNEDTAYTFSSASFGYSDVEGSALASVRIDTLPAAGTLLLSGVPVTAGQVIPAANLGNLTFAPAANANGTGYASFTFSVNDGTGFDATPNTITMNVTAINDTPVNTVPAAQTTAEDTTKAITGLSISDVDAGGASMTVTLAVTNGTLTVSGGTATISGSGTSSVTLTGTAAAINATLAATVNYVPSANFNGTATLTITTSDNGNSGSGGTLTDIDTVSITVTAVNDLPTGTDNTFTTNEDTAYTFSAASFGYSDVEGSALASVRIDTLPAAGTLLLSGVPVTAGQVITAANLGNLTFAPAANANGTGYASFTFSVNDGTGFDATPNSITLNVTAVADTPELFTPSQLNALVAGVSTASATASVSKANLAGAIGLPSATLDSFDPPPGPGTNDPGTVNVNDGGLTNYNYTLASGMSVVFDWAFTNAENLVADINNGFNDIVVLVVTNPDGTQTSILITSSEQAGAGTNTSGTYNFTAPTAGSYQFSWLALNARDTINDSSIAISNIAFQMGASTFGTPIEFPISTALVDTDGSETLAVTVAGVPAGAAFSAGTNLGGGSWSFTAAQLPGLIFLPADGYTGTVNLTVTATTTETSNGSIASTTQTVAVTVTETTNTMTGTNGNNTLTGTVNNDHIQGLSGNDTLSGGAGNDLIFGGAGSDTLNGNDGNDRLYGGAGTDILNGGNGNDTLIGGSGNDTLTGGIGSDVFRWELADQGAAGVPAMDTITDFDISLPAAGGDILDLRDLLVGESHSGSSPGTLDDYLHFEISGANTIVHISTSGGFSSGFNAALDDQQITLTGVDLVTGFANDNAIITDLLTKNKLITD